MKKINFLFLITILFCNLSSYAQRIGFSDETWKSIKTEHFDILFSAQQQDLGLYYAQVAEKAYQNLQTVFTEKPDRTVIVINDSTDASNGYATRIPYPLIMAFPVQINDHDSLSEAGEWARELITHEMTHILQFEPALGFYKYIRPVFGTIVAPNLLLPVWWKEGMAVEMETQFSPRGRLRSNYQDASLRAMVLDRKLFSYTLASVNEMLPSWPFGMRPYLFGSVFWSQLLKEKGISTADFIAQRHGQRVPYFVEAPMQELTGEDYENQYIKALSEIEGNALAQAETLKKLTPTDFEIIKIEGQSAQQPLFSKKHQLLAFIESKEGESELTLLNPDRTFFEPLKNRPTGHIDHIVFHPTLKQIYFTKMERFNSKQNFSDLYVYDIDADKSTRLTWGQRIRDPHFSEDGSQIVFIATFHGKTQLKLFDVATKAITLLLDSHFQERFYSPLFWKPQTILWTQRTAEGKQILQQLDLASHTVTELNLKYKNISFLKKENDRLYFVSSENGVANIYSSSDLKTAVAHTHCLTGVWSYSIDSGSQRILATIMTGDGFRIATTKLRDIPEKLPAIENKVADRYNYVDRTKGVPSPPSEDYSATEYLWPHYWIPFVSSATTSNGVFIQAQTAGQDPLQIHRYSLMANYQTDIEKGGFVGIYGNAALSVPFQIAVLQTNQTFGTVEQIVETKTNSISLLPDVFRINKNLTFQIGLQDQQTELNGFRTQHTGAFTQIGFSNYAQNIYQISPESGWGATLRYERNQNVRGSIDYNKTVASLIGFTNWLLPKHHVLMMRIDGLATFENVQSRFGTSNSLTFAAEDAILPQFVIRGYPASHFYGRSLWTLNTEYRFPVSNLEKGSGTKAFFLKRLSGAVIADGIGVQGRGIDGDLFYHPLQLNESLWSAGIEAKLETTVGYILPLNFIAGCYIPFSPLYAKAPQVGLGLQLGGF